ncbi:MAG: DUF433 domain-containing protein [Ignavibacteriales bacterium]|nr:MAG: DUF433 domain-containing protein [Ignavibacteriales bacterium]
MKSLLERITIDPEVCHGKPCIRNMRFPLEVVLGLLSSGMTMDEILADHPQLEREDILASFEYANILLKTKSFRMAS